MAFTGTPTATLLGDNICRVSGITLAAGQSGHFKQDKWF